jgi:branched-subunit amino acid aminotransferase/4-amino-4-deoxychorismate lyase
MDTDGLFETARCVGGVIQAWPAHLARLEAGCRRLGLTFPEGLAALQVAGDAKVNVYVRPDGWTMRCAPLPPPHTPVALDVARRPAGIRDLKMIDRRGWEPHDREVAWVDGGRLSETSRANLFVVRSGALWTAPTDGGILPGVTRARVVAAARALGVPVVEAPVAFGAADEVFTTSALRILAPVTRIGDRVYPGWGPLGRALAAEVMRDAVSTPQIGTFGRTRSSS